MCLFHATGDRRWLSDPYRPRRDVRLIADEDAGFSPDIESRIRNAAIEVFGALDQSPAITDPGDELMVEMMRWCMNEEIDAAYAPMMREDLGFTPRDVEITSELAADRHVLVIGAGASGIVLGARLKRMGVPFTILERATDVGGTWRDNIYPGCGVDTPNHAYSYSIGAREPWTRTFSPQPELLAYLQRCTDEFGVRDHIRFDSEVVGCRWDDDDHTWELSTRSADGHTTTATGTDVVVAIGHFGKPSTPDLPGADLFTGPMFHTARWPADIDLTGKRVVIVGTGASAMQIVPSIVDQVGHLTVIQRSPQWVRPIPRYHEDLSDDTQWLLANVPFYAEWFRFTMLWRYGDGLLPFLKKDPDWPFPERSLNRVNERHRQQMVDHIHAELGDRQDLIDVCTPTYPPYGKRILLDNGWYQALLRPNVSLAVGEVTEITAGGVVTDDGVEHAADVIVMSTGFRITRDDGLSDQLAGRCFATYDEAYALLERYYADLCCSDDREYYRIEPIEPA